MSKFGKFVLLPLLLIAAAAGAQQGGDLQAQILYAFQTEDSTRLAELIQALSTQVKTNESDASLRYHLAHAQYRFGLIVEQNRGAAAQAAFSDCVDQLKTVLKQDVKSVEALALQSACYSELAGFGKLEAGILRSRAADRLNAAFRLAPRNPRVVFLMAMNGMAGAKPASAELRRAAAQLQLAAQLFEQSSSTGIDAPGWGHAEAYLALGRELESRGDFLGARNWIEKSLVAAPDFKAAQRQQTLLAEIMHER